MKSCRVKTIKWVTKEKLHDLYINQRMTQGEIAKVLQKSRSRVCVVMHYFNIPVRENYREANRTSLCRQCGKEFLQKTHRTFYCSERCKQDVKNSSSKVYNSRIRERVLKMYGGKCCCCGEGTSELLTLDHVKNDGKEWRATGEHRGNGVYLAAIREYRPDIFQLLCWNCNWGKATYGICPHKNERRNCVYPN